MDKPTVGVVSLGCSKNLTDTEQLLGYLEALGFGIVSDASDAELIIVNSCGFIEPAKQESINTILEMAVHKFDGCCTCLAVCGCLSQRYMAELKAELPEVDVLWGVKDQLGLARLLAERFGISADCPLSTPRLLATPPWAAYLRIADGCSNRCTYCAIPLIRGDRVSVPMQALLDEARALAAGGVKELTLIAQDTTSYGMDICGKSQLPELLTRLNDVDGLKWIRILYTYPDTVTKELIDTVCALEKTVNYIDMPIQHINDRLLKAMNRRGDSSHIKRTVDYIRSKRAPFIIRSTAIVGFPGESEAEFDELTEFLREYPIDRLGAFEYSAEDGTPAASFEGLIPDSVKAERLDRLMRLQGEVSLMLNRRRLGTRCEVLVEEVGDGVAAGRSFGEAPDVDGRIIFTFDREVEPGDFAEIMVTEADEYDLKGRAI